MAGISERHRESRLRNAKNYNTSENDRYHWCENLYLDLITDASIKEVKREESNKEICQDMIRSKFHRCLKCCGEMLKCSEETLGKIFACTRGESTESSKNPKTG